MPNAAPIPTRTALILLAAAIVCGEVLGYAAPSVQVAAPAGLAFAALAAWLLHRVLLAPLRQSTANAASQAEVRDHERGEQLRRLRHDLRGAMSPMLLIADRLGAHADPAVKRSGDIMVMTVERATALLEEPASPPAGP